MTSLEKQIQGAIAGRYPIIYLHTSEEDRVAQVLRRLATTSYDGVPVVSWTCTRGFAPPLPVEDSRDPVTAVQSIVRSGQAGFYLMNDLPEFLDQPVVTRALRDAYYALLPKRHMLIFIISPVVVIPASLEKNVILVDVDPPGLDELQDMVRELVAGYTTKSIPADMLAEIGYALSGLTLDDARHVMYRVLSREKLSRHRILDEIGTAKKAMVNQAAYLEYVPHEKDINQIGGLKRLKQWIDTRKGVFNRHAMEAGLPIPRGILIMGVSGCGKSLCAKVIARTWQVPLYRLDMNLVFAQMYGNPEATFHRALRTIESLAPAVLWIDEIENGLGLEEADRAMPSHIMSAFLTWMQEKPSLVFVTATANRIESLPAEMIRKGRFDQIFFCDLPDRAERDEIFRIHILANGGNPEDFDLDRLVTVTVGWNAAEIEQAVTASRIDAASEDRLFTTDDIVKYADTVVPLSRTMSEQIKRIRDWAWDRATWASGKTAHELSLGEG